MRRAASDAWHLAETNNLLLVRVRLAVLGMAGEGGRWPEVPESTSNPKSGGGDCHSYSAVGSPGGGAGRLGVII